MTEGSPLRNPSRNKSQRSAPPSQGSRWYDEGGEEEGSGMKGEGEGGSGVLCVSLPHWSPQMGRMPLLHSALPQTGKFSIKKIK